MLTCIKCCGEYGCEYDYWEELPGSLYGQTVVDFWYAMHRVKLGWGEGITKSKI